MPGKCLDGESKTRRFSRQIVIPDGRRALGEKWYFCTASSVYYNISKRDIGDKWDKLCYSAINL